MMNC
jgi:hypothetical protein